MWDALAEHLRLFGPKNRAKLSLEEMVAKCSEKVLEDASYLCGFIRDKEDSTMLAELRMIDDTTLASLREERFLRLILSSVDSQDDPRGQRLEGQPRLSTRQNGADLRSRGGGNSARDAVDARMTEDKNFKLCIFLPI